MSHYLNQRWPEEGTMLGAADVSRLVAAAEAERAAFVSRHVGSALAPLGHAVAGLWRRSLGWWVARQRLTATLEQLSDRELQDIGVSRSDIPAIVRGTYRRAAGTAVPGSRVPAPAPIERDHLPLAA